MQPLVIWPLTFFIVWLDERRMSAEMLERAWPPATKVIIPWFSPFLLLVHFIRTRRNFVGVLLGIAAVAFVLVVYFALVAITGVVLGIDVFADK